ncbi:MAG: PaeR7I family type II restriction endonuclease [Planctomycetota bacterium]
MTDLSRRLEVAVREFWQTRQSQSERQGSTTGTRDTGARAAVTGGAQMNGFVQLVRALLSEVGVADTSISVRRGVELPGWFRAEKAWDLLVVIDKRLIATVEFKSQVGPSFGNNFNNRTEEALGSATDLLAAYREGAFAPAARPWLGYLMLLEESAGSTRPVRIAEPHFEVFPEFRGTSYAKRYEILLTKLVRERLYDAACLLLTDRDGGPRGQYREPIEELAFVRFVESLLARVMAAIRAR